MEADEHGVVLSAGRARDLVSRLSLSLSLVSNEPPMPSVKRRSAQASYEVVESIGQRVEMGGWEVDVSRALLNKCGLKGDREMPKKARGKGMRPQRSKLQGLGSRETLGRLPFSSIQNTMSHHNENPNAKSSRPIITPASISRRAAATTRSFSSLPPKITTTAASPVSGSSFLAPPSLAVIAPTPEASPSTPSKRVHHKSVPETPSSVLREGTFSESPRKMQKSYSSGSTGKRKAEETIEPGSITPPKESREQRATFAPEPRPHRPSASSYAPSSYTRKRARLSIPSDRSNTPSRSSSRGPSPFAHPPLLELNSKTTGSWSSRKSAGPEEIQGRRQTQRSGSTATATSQHTRNNSWSHAFGIGERQSIYENQQNAPSRHSLSQLSIPISALISPHAPSVANSGTFHMRDPRKPRVQSTPWSLALPHKTDRETTRWELSSWVERGGSPLHAWFFFCGFVLFPIWWVASFVGVPQTRRLGTDTVGVEKGVVLDDPQVEFDARSWRTRCRVMTIVSLFTYIPFIVCVIIFAR